MGPGDTSAGQPQAYSGHGYVEPAEKLKHVRLDYRLPNFILCDCLEAGDSVDHRRGKRSIRERKTAFGSELSPLRSSRSKMMNCVDGSVLTNSDISMML